MMPMHNYFESADSVLPTTDASLLTVVPYSTIAAANEAVKNVIIYSDTGEEETADCLECKQRVL